MKKRSVLLFIMIASLLAIGCGKDKDADKTAAYQAGKGNSQSVQEDGTTGQSGESGNAADDEQGGSTIEKSNKAREEYLASLSGGSDYPVADSFASGDGTKESPFEISTVEELARLEYILNATVEGNDVDLDEKWYAQSAYYILTNDLQMNDVSDFDSWETNAPEYGWDPVYDFTGHFDGQGHTITGLYSTPYRCGNGTYAGFIASAGNDAVIENLNFEKEFLTGTAGGIAGIVGDGYGIQIRNCNVDAIVIGGGSQFGGIIANASECIIDSCSFTGSVSSINNVDNEMVWTRFSSLGGIAGFSYGSIIRSCSSDAKMVSKDATAGGIAGKLGTALGSSSNSRERYPDTLSKITAQSSTGIENCTFDGVVAGGYEVGGICGSMASTTMAEPVDREIAIINSVNNGSVNAANAMMPGAGGICGHIQNEDIIEDGTEIFCTFRIEGCENTGEVNTPTNKTSGGAGGILGSCNMDGGIIKVQKCENSGTITAGGCAGGIVGDMNFMGNGSLVMEDLVNNGEAKGGSYSGGIGGNVVCAPWGDNKGVTMTMKGCHNYADVTCNATKGGLFGSFMPGIKEDTPIGNYTFEDCSSTGDYDLFGTSDSIEALLHKVGDAMGSPDAARDTN